MTPPRDNGSWVLVQKPRPASAGAYDAAIAAVRDHLAAEAGVLAVYKLGSVGAPGISDIDMLAVFEDDARCLADPLSRLPRELRYLFTHGVFGMPHWHFQDAVRYGHYPDLSLLWGRDIERGAAASLDAGERSLLDVQIALEYLLANYISRSIEMTYRVVNVRGLLLAVHAVRFDLDLLGIREGRLGDLVRRLGQWRQDWFACGRTGNELVPWLAEFQTALHAALEESLRRHSFYLRADGEVRYARHVRIRRGAGLKMHHRGIVLPAWLLRGRKAIRLQHRLNRFLLEIPLTTTAPSRHIARRSEREAEARRYCDAYLPHFSLPAPRLASLVSQTSGASTP